MNSHKNFENIKSLPITERERAKVSHEINNVWHTRFKGKRVCMIITHSHEIDSPSFEYDFINHGYDHYEFLAKRPTIDWR